MKAEILVIFFMGIIISIIGYYTSMTQCTPSKNTVRFVDRTVEEAQKDAPQNLNQLYQPMFQDAPVLI